MYYKKLKKLSHKDTKTQRKSMNFKPISNKEEALAKKIVDSAYQVYKELGPGLLEKVYEKCFCH
jgi:hypothetical protein